MLGAVFLLPTRALYCLVMDTVLFLLAILLWSLYATYYILFHLLAPKKAHTEVAVVKRHEADHARPTRSTHDGFRAYAKDGELTVEDIVKALSREQGG